MQNRERSAKTRDTGGAGGANNVRLRGGRYRHDGSQNLLWSKRHFATVDQVSAAQVALDGCNGIRHRRIAIFSHNLPYPIQKPARTPR